MSGRCKDCRHWQKPYRYASAHYYPGWRACALAYREDMPVVGANLLPASPPLAVEAGPNEAELLTAPDFGCTAFAPKEAT